MKDVTKLVSFTCPEPGICKLGRAAATEMHLVNYFLKNIAAFLASLELPQYAGWFVATASTSWRSRDVNSLSLNPS